MPFKRLCGRTALFLGLAVFTLAMALHAEAPRLTSSQIGQEQVSDVMKAKLRHSQALLQGIALEDFDAIVKTSQDLSLLSQESSWNVIQTPDYLQHSIDFRRAADAINEAAKDKNLDGVTLAYFQMTIRCVDCHRHIRAVKSGE